MLVKGVGNCEIIVWTIGSILACHLIAWPIATLFKLDHDWRVPKGGEYKDYAELIRKQNLGLRNEFVILYDQVDKGATQVTLPYFNPEVYCPYLLPVGGRKLCAPWLFKSPVKKNKIDVEKWVERRKRVVLNKVHLSNKGGVEGDSDCDVEFYYAAKSETKWESKWKNSLPCTLETFPDGISLTGKSSANDVLFVGAGDKGENRFSSSTLGALNGVNCQIVVDLKTSIVQTVKDLRDLAKMGYRIMYYENITATEPTARFSFIQSNCTDHFGVKYIQKYLA
ncbi:hypothetical protein PENTCL1PPCAC_19128 [Pristionchus entomophagus]|uniref:Methyltransferase n=1 Tax=Pristionchus entomophagus TaxID=358040 RepID=A0AAV5TRU3_9BILA|nr:hypothetical protein PENTCL1PPCAC_19128 [Pristionchus entomophagus]